MNTLKAPTLIKGSRDLLLIAIQFYEIFNLIQTTSQ